jgi:hypothetical protein
MVAPIRAANIKNTIGITLAAIMTHLPFFFFVFDGLGLVPVLLEPTKTTRLPELQLIVITRRSQRMPKLRQMLTCVTKV